MEEQMNNIRKVTLTNPSYTFAGVHPKIFISFDTNKTDVELDGMIVDGLETTHNKTTENIKCKLYYEDNILFGEKIK